MSRRGQGKVGFARTLAAGAAGLAAIAAADFAAAQHVPTRGPDVILGVLDNTVLYARKDGIAALAATTISCNKGDTVIEWLALPSNQHPVISLNLYRLMDGRMQQIGQSFVKHGIFAVQGDACSFGCNRDPNHPRAGDVRAGRALGLGCSDPYGAGLNAGPGLGSRRDINPTTGYYDGAKVVIDDTAQGPRGQDIRRGLQVREADLALPNARYFIEGHYVTADDAASGNGYNNVSHREITIQRTALDQIVFQNVATTTRERAAIEAWEGASIAWLRNPEARAGEREIASQIAVASKVTPIAGTSRHRYDYVIYNMNSDQGVRALSIPVPDPAKVTDIGFYAVFSHDEQLSNEPWTAKVEGGKITWSTKASAEDANANAIRWGTAYNFWFTAEAPPADIEAELGLFKQGPKAVLSSKAACAPGAACVVKGPGR